MLATQETTISIQLVLKRVKGWDAVLDTGKWQMVKTELVTVGF